MGKKEGIQGRNSSYGLRLPASVNVRVYDSTADMRYLVVPKRPSATEGMSEQELAQLITRDSMIDVVQALPSHEGE